MVLVIGVAWKLSTEGQPVSMRVLGLSSQRWSDDVAPQMDTPEFVAASIELTNSSSRPISYSAYNSGRHPVHSLIKKTANGWEEPPAAFCGTGIEQATLLPGCSVVFSAVVAPDQPCRISLDYNDGRRSSRLRRKLPAWLKQRASWFRDWRTVTTGIIDLREVTIPPPDPKPATGGRTKSIFDLQVSAHQGNAEAQVELAGRYWLGRGMEKDVRDAVRWYQAAATNGHAEAAYTLGAIYEHGLSGEADKPMALQWYRQAASTGHASARERVGVLEAR